ncbi:MAG: HD domain-containing protein [Clostridia bacterium]|nr:HD domain-containing protein [Clostridia bacterium]
MEEQQLIQEFEDLDIQEDVKEHSKRVMTLSGLIALNLQKNQDINLSSLRIAALYHDVGKMYIPKTILNKPGRLTDQEMNTMKLHVKFSGKYVADRGLPSKIVKIILHHHETCNGTGYPFGLSGEVLNVESKILRVADIYDALTSDRPYRDAHTQREALNIILERLEEYDERILKALFEVLGLEAVDVEKIA